MALSISTVLYFPLDRLPRSNMYCTIIQTHTNQLKLLNLCTHANLTKNQVKT